jgi:hypothetical protein
MHSHNHHLASVPGDNDDHLFDLNDPLEDQENMHAGDYLAHVQVMFVTIIVHVKMFHHQFTHNQNTIYNFLL